MESRIVTGDNFVIFNSDHDTWETIFGTIPEEENVDDNVLAMIVDQFYHCLQNQMKNLNNYTFEMLAQPFTENSLNLSFEGTEQHTKAIWCCLVATKICICLAAFKSKTMQTASYIVVKNLLDPVKKIVGGRLYRLISELEEKCDVISPVQAPKGWRCSLCMSSSLSHLTVKTSCNHSFHFGCYQRLNSPICPNCRSHIKGVNL